MEKKVMTLFASMKQHIEALEKTPQAKDLDAQLALTDELIALREMTAKEHFTINGVKNLPLSIDIAHGNPLPNLFGNVVIDTESGKVLAYITEIKGIQWIEKQAAIRVHVLAQLSEYVPPVPALQTIPQWCAHKQIEIIDPDGFDRSDKHLMSRLFTEEEFEKGLVRSTIRRIVVEKPEAVEEEEAPKPKDVQKPRERKVAKRK